MCAQRVRLERAVSRSRTSSNSAQVRLSQGWENLCHRKKTNNRRVKASLQERARLCGKECVNPSGSRRLLHGVMRSFEDQAGQVEGQGEGVREEHGFGGVGQAKRGRAFEMSASLGRIAALGIGLSADA